MANLAITGLTALTGANLASGDLSEVVDISDATYGVGGTNKKITAGELLIGLAAISSGVTLGGSLTLSNGTQTTSKPILDLSQTWNAAGVAFVGNTNNFTNTASAAASMMENWSIGGVRMNSLRKDGAILSWNGANDDTNYERGFARWTANVFEIGTEKGGTGTERDLKLWAGATYYLGYGTTGTLTMGGANVVTISNAGVITSTNGYSFQYEGTKILTLQKTEANAQNDYLSIVANGVIGPNGSNLVFYPFERATDAATVTTTVRGQLALATAATNITGGPLYLYGGSGASSSAGAAHGGNLYLRGGTGYGTGTVGGIYLGDTGGTIYLNKTVTAAGTTGAQTINKVSGTVNFAAAATTLVVTNSLVTTSSTIYVSERTADATARIAHVVPAAGSFTITLTAAATAETSVGFLVVN